MTLYIEIMIGIFIGSGVGFGLSYLTRLRLTKESRLAQISNFELSAKDILSKATLQTTAANGLLLHVHNSGGKMQVGHRVFSSVIAEFPETEELRQKDEWRKVEVMEDYLSIIRRLHNEKTVMLHTEEMNNGTLKRLYHRLGVVGSLVFEVYSETENSYFYASFPVRKNLEALMLDTEFSTLEAVVNSLKSLCRRNHRAKIIS